jgi:hypothetical protein
MVVRTLVAIWFVVGLVGCSSTSTYSEPVVCPCHYSMPASTPEPAVGAVPSKSVSLSSGESIASLSQPSVVNAAMPSFQGGQTTGTKSFFFVRLVTE